MNLEDVITSISREAGANSVKLDIARLAQTSTADKPGRVTLLVTGTEVPNCHKLKSFVPHAGAKVLYATMRSGQIVVLGEVG